MTVSNRAGRDFVQLSGRRSADPLEAVQAASSVRIVELERVPGRTAHRHPLSEEVVYVAAGRGVVWIDGEVERIEYGDVIHIPIGAAHATVPDPGESMHLICFFPHPRLADNLEDTEVEVT